MGKTVLGELLSNVGIERQICSVDCCISTAIGVEDPLGLARE